jgi:hypothetical protein
MLRLVTSIALALAVISTAAIGYPSAEVKFSTADLTFEVHVYEGDTYDVPAMATASHQTDSVGAPCLPYSTVYILIPQHQTGTGSYRD